MQIQSTTVFGLLICFSIIILIAMLRSKHFFKCIILSAFSGIACLFAVNALSSITGFSLAVNYPTLAISAIGGTPGVILLLLSRVIVI